MLVFREREFMKFSEEKKTAIKRYILEKVSQGAPALSRTVAATFEVNPSTIHSYINELEKDNIIKKVKRGEYALVCRDFTYELCRSKGDLEDDTYAFDACLKVHIKEFETNVQNIWDYVLSEMVNNVMDHSMAENLHVTVSQDFLTTRVILYDDGVGIFRKIMEHFGFSTADEAICELFKGKLTTDPRNHSGEGIFFSSKLMDNFFIVSDGKIFTSNKYDDSRIFDLMTEAKKGTCIIMELSNFSRKTPKDIFDTYANVDGGFIRTKIPLKNMFDSAPVSRSQAKRVCNRLEKFQEVVVDFDEIDWVGQGFAHQLFVNFQNAHPDIRILPENMNDDVAKMYHHVTGTSS